MKEFLPKSYSRSKRKGTQEGQQSYQQQESRTQRTQHRQCDRANIKQIETPISTNPEQKLAPVSDSRLRSTNSTQPVRTDPFPSNFRHNAYAYSLTRRQFQATIIYFKKKLAHRFKRKHRRISRTRAEIKRQSTSEDKETQQISIGITSHAFEQPIGSHNSHEAEKSPDLAGPQIRIAAR